MSEMHEDVVQIVIDRIFQSDASYEKKMVLLDALEPVIEKAHAQGLTAIHEGLLVQSLPHEIRAAIAFAGNPDREFERFVDDIGGGGSIWHVRFRS